MQSATKARQRSCLNSTAMAGEVRFNFYSIANHFPLSNAIWRQQVLNIFAYRPNMPNDFKWYYLTFSGYLANVAYVSDHFHCREIVVQCSSAIKAQAGKLCKIHCTLYKCHAWMVAVSIRRLKKKALDLV